MATYYWVGGSGTWDSTTTTNWAASSGGAGGAGVPSFGDNVVFDANSNTGTSSFTVTAFDPYCQDLTIGSLDGAMTLSSGDFIITGDVTLPATNFSFSGASSINFYLTKNASITTNGISIPAGYFLLFDDNSGYTLTLNDNLTLSANLPSGGYTAVFNLLNSANLNLNGKTLTTHSVDLTQIQPTGAYRLIFGTTGKIVVTGYDTTVWKDYDGGGSIGTYAYASGSCNVEFTSTAGSGTTAISMSQALAGVMPSGSSIYNVKVNAGTNTVTLNAVSSSYACVKNLDFTGFSGTFSSTSNRRIEGNLTFSSTMTVSTLSNTTLFAGVSDVTTNGKTITSACQLTGSMTLQDAFTMSNTLIFTINNTSGTATLNLNNFTFTTGLFSMSSTSSKVIAFGSTGKIVLSRAGIGTASIWSAGTINNFSYTGTSRVETSGAGTGTRNFVHGSTSGGTESNAINLYIKTSPPTVVILGHFKDLDFTGSSSNLSQNSLTQLNVYGNLTLSATLTGTVGTGVGTTGGFHFKGGSGVTQYITTNGNNIGCGYYAFEGAATYVLNDNITATAASSEVVCGVYVFNGIFDSNDKTINVNALLFSPVYGNAQIYLKNSNITTRSLFFYTPSAYSGVVYPGTSTITATNLLDTSLYFGTYNFNNVVVSTSGNTTYRMGGTIENFTHTVTSTRTMSFEAGKTFTFGAFNCTGTSSFRLTMQHMNPSSTTLYTLAKSNSTKVNLSYCTISDFFAGNASVWIALTSNGNINSSNNYGIQFTPPTGKGLQFFS
jgi:hypothetical protein